MASDFFGTRRRNRRARAEPAPFWGEDIGEGATKAYSSSSQPCTSCGGLSSFCRNCRKDAPGSPTSALDIKDVFHTSINGDMRTGAKALGRFNAPGALAASALNVPDAISWGSTVVDDRGLTFAPVAPGLQPPPTPPEVAQRGLPWPGTLDSFIDPEASTAASLVDLKDLDQQQIKEWNFKLQEQVEILEQEKRQLQELYATCKEQRENLEAELQKARERYTELESLFRQGVAQSAKAKSIQDENQQLRKQLAAYSIEIDVLRQDLRMASLPGYGAEHEKKLEEMQRIFDEEKARLESDHNQTIEDHKALDERYRLLDKDYNELGDMHSQLGDGHRKLEEGHRSIAEELERKTKQVSEQSQLICDLRHDLRQYRQVAETLQDGFVDQTRLFADLTTRFREAANRVGGVVKDDEKDLAQRMNLINFSAFDHFDHLTSKTDQWKAIRGLKKLCFVHWVWGALRIGFAKPSCRYLRYDIAWEMACARQGFVLTKVRHDTHRLEDRLVILDAELGILRWGDLKQSRRGTVGEMKHGVKNVNRNDLKHATLKKKELTSAEETKIMEICPDADDLKALLKQRAQEHGKYLEFHKDCVDCGCLSKFTRGLDLRDVTCIDYGVSNRASVISQTKPWKCFSLWTKERSYDFVCADQEVARCFVLAISRVIYCIKKSMPGRLSISEQFPPPSDRKALFCENNHPIPPGSTECVWKCGSVKQETVCTNHHKMLPGQVTCTTCGNFRKKATTAKTKRPRGETSTWQPTQLPEWTNAVRGGVQTRGQFIALQGWCKLMYFAMAGNTTLAKVFLQAAITSVFQKTEHLVSHSPAQIHSFRSRHPPLPPPHEVP